MIVEAETGVFVHPSGICESEHVAAGTRVWAFSHILPGARIELNCNICDHVFIENDVVLGDRVTIKSGVQLWDGVRLADDVFIGPNVSFTNDRFPRSKKFLSSPMLTRVEHGASIGANATILPGIVIGEHAMIGAGAVVTMDVPPRGIAVGNPARVVGFATSLGNIKSLDGLAGPDLDVLGTGKATLLPLHQSNDARGSLGVVEHERLPFKPARTFFVTGVQQASVRGVHAHKTCGQILIVAAGALTALVDDGEHSRSVRLDAPTYGLHLPCGTWSSQCDWVPGTVLIVLASAPYDKDDYINSYADFQSFL